MTRLRVFRQSLMMQQRYQGSPPTNHYTPPSTPPSEMSNTRKFLYSSSYLFFYTQCPSERSFNAAIELGPQLLAEARGSIKNWAMEDAENIGTLDKLRALGRRAISNLNLDIATHMFPIFGIAIVAVVALPEFGRFFVYFGAMNHWHYLGRVAVPAEWNGEK